MDALSAAIKELSKKFGDDSIHVGIPKSREASTLSLGSPSLDFCLYNHLIEGSFYEINGLEGSGKTTLSFLIASDYIKKELKRNPTHPRKILFVDAECACDPEWALKSTGYDMNSKELPTIYIQGSGQSAEEYFDMVISCLKTGEIGLVIFDSLSMIASSQVVDESLDKKEIGSTAKAIGDFVKRSVGLLNKYKSTFIGINGLSENVGGYGDPLIAGGGKTWKRGCIVRLRVKRGTFFNEDDEELKTKDAKSPAGHIIEMYVEKTKVCRWDRKLGYMHLNYTKGVDLLWDTIDTATHLGVIKALNQMTFALVDPDTGEILKDKNGKEIKVTGKKNLKPYLLENLDLWKRIYNKCYELLSKQEDSNIIPFEKMLGIDVSSLLTSDEDGMEDKKIEEKKKEKEEK